MCWQSTAQSDCIWALGDKNYTAVCAFPLMQPHIPDKIKARECIHKLALLQTVRITRGVSRARLPCLRGDEVPVTWAEENPYDSAVVEETMSAVTVHQALCTITGTVALRLHNKAALLQLRLPSF